MNLIICKYCNKEFEQTNKNKKFCSKECQKNYNKSKEYRQELKKIKSNVKCNFCGKEFHKTPSTIRDLNFCCRKCQNTFLARRQHEKSLDGKIEKCSICGKIFYRNKKEKIKSKMSFCSKECRNKYYEKHRTNKICEICGKEFTVALSRKNTSRFCSVECQLKWQRRFYKKVKCTNCKKEMLIDKTKQLYNKSNKFFCCNKCVGKYYTGKNSPTYKGISDITSSLRYYYENYQRKEIFAKYKKVCQKCGCVAEEVHHIVPLHKIIDNFIKNNKLPTETPEDRQLIINLIIEDKENIFNDLDNLIPLCKNCHKKEHVRRK